jgi:hypothetical protein
MNNMHEKDWAVDIWHGHTGIDCSSGFCFLEEDTEDQSPIIPEAATENRVNTVREKKS